jgi:sec-independent protein translocase protein TatB
MFDVGFWELTIIAVVALLVLGPERLPALARTAGTWMGRARRLAMDLRRELEREVDVRSDLRDLGGEIAGDNQDGVAKDVENVLAGSVDRDSNDRQ